MMKFGAAQITCSRIEAVAYLKINGRITNREYQKVADTSRLTAIRELAELVAKRIFKRLGAARGAYYIVVKKQIENDSNDSCKIASIVTVTLYCLVEWLHFNVLDKK